MIWVISITILVVLLQISAFSILGFGFVVLQPFLLFLGILFYLEDENYLFWSMLVGGLLLDTFSTRPFGNFLLIFLAYFLISIAYLHTSEKFTKYVRSLAFIATTSLITTFISLLWQSYPFWSNLGISICNAFANSLFYLFLLKLISKYTIDERRF